jgi:hypothetical protein
MAASRYLGNRTMLEEPLERPRPPARVASCPEANEPEGCGAPARLCQAHPPVPGPTLHEPAAPRLPKQETGRRRVAPEIDTRVPNEPEGARNRSEMSGGRAGSHARAPCVDDWSSWRCGPPSARRRRNLARGAAVAATAHRKATSVEEYGRRHAQAAAQRHHPARALAHVQTSQSGLMPRAGRACQVTMGKRRASRRRG